MRWNKLRRGSRLATHTAHTNILPSVTLDQMYQKQLECFLKILVAGLHSRST